MCFVSTPHVPAVRKTKKCRRASARDILGIKTQWRHWWGGTPANANENICTSESVGLSGRGQKKCRLTGRKFRFPRSEGASDELV